MAGGFYTYINGTSFDVLNSMSFNFVIDVIYANAGTYSVSYSGYPALNIQLIPMTTLASTATMTFSYSQSGNTVTFTTSRAAQIVVFASPVGGQASPYAGFQLYQDDGTVKLAPTFTPFNLVQVIDASVANGQLVQTNIPAGTQVLAFHRATTADMDQVLWSETTQNGFYALNIISANYSSSTGPIPVRIYLFAKKMLNPPSGGFFMYNNGVMVWHSNCLPLKLNQISDATGNPSSPTVPKAVLSSIGSNRNINNANGTYRQQYLASSAGWDGSNWTAGRQGYLYVNNTVTGSTPAGWTNPYGGYIDTDAYDAYYKQALGV